MHSSNNVKNVGTLNEEQKGARMNTANRIAVKDYLENWVPINLK